MKLPQSPSKLASILRDATPAALRLIMQQATPLPTGHYLHWDELRHRPAPDGLSHPQWWASVCFARAPLMQELPLLDKHGLPLRCATPSPVLIDLHHIDRDAAGQLKSAVAGSLQEDSQRFLLNSLIEEAITSSQLEGASTTRRVASDMLHSGRRPRDHSETMIFNNYRVMEQLRSLKNEPLTPALILELHRLLTTGVLDDPADAGRLRHSDDIHIVDRRSNTLLHEPPHHGELAERLERLCAFANADEHATPFVHPVLRAILLHFMIGYDHPFVDGNGRTARALFYWSMARSGYWLMEYASISHILRRAPARYLRAWLHTETDDNDTTYFLLQQLDTIRQAILALHDYLLRKGRELRQTEQLLASSVQLRTRFNQRQLALLTHALQQADERYRIETHQRSHGVTYQTARTDLLDLHTLGLLEKGQQGKAYVFFAPRDLRERLKGLAR